MDSKALGTAYGCGPITPTPQYLNDCIDTAAATGNAIQEDPDVLAARAAAQGLFEDLSTDLYAMIFGTAHSNANGTATGKPSVDDDILEFTEANVLALKGVVTQMLSSRMGCKPDGSVLGVHAEYGEKKPWATLTLQATIQQGVQTVVSWEAASSFLTAVSIVSVTILLMARRVGGGFYPLVDYLGGGGAMPIDGCIELAKDLNVDSGVAMFTPAGTVPPGVYHTIFQITSTLYGGQPLFHCDNHLVTVQAGL